MSVAGLDGKFSEASRRALMAIPGMDLVRCGFVGEPPADAEGYEVRPGFKVPKWPPRYLTPGVMRVVGMFRLAELGMPPLVDGSVHWPAPLAQAFCMMATLTRAERMAARG